MSIDDFDMDEPFGRFDEQPDAGAAADSADSEKAVAQLPRLLRHAVLSADFQPHSRQRLVAEIGELAADLTARAQAWGAGLGDHDGVTFASDIDHLAAARDQPTLRSVADSLRLLTLAPNMSSLGDLRRVANALALAERGLPTDLPPKIRESVLTLVLGWSAVAAGSVERATSSYTRAIDAAWSIGEIRIRDLRDLVDEERRIADENHAKRTGAEAKRSDHATEPPPLPGYVRVARVSTEAMRWTRTKELASGLDAVLTADLPLTRAPDLQTAAARLEARFPHAKPVTDKLLGDLVGAEYVQFRPTIIVGPPGAGKTTFARALCETLAIGYYRHDAARSDSGAFAGQDRRWHSAEPSHALQALAQTRLGSTCIHIDEVEKASSRRDGGRLWDVLLSYTEPETARSIRDPALQVPVDLSTCSYICTANDINRLPAPLRDRFRIVEMPEPTVEHIPALLPGIVDAILRNRNADPRWLTPFTPDDLAWLAQAWGGGSIRKLARVVEALMDAPDATDRRH